MRKIAAAFLLLFLCANAAFAESETSFEGYVLSHVKKEMSPNWHIEALKAQAVLARTFELKAGHGDMTSTADLSLASNCERAVAETRALVLKYNGELASVFYHADSGGAVSTAEYVWGGKNLPYLAVKSDVFTTQSPNQLWQKSISKADFESLLLTNGISVGTPVSFSNIVRDESGRIKTLDIVGTLGRSSVSGNKLRTILGLKSTLVNFGEAAPAYSVSYTQPPSVQSKSADYSDFAYSAPSPAKRKNIDINQMPQSKEDKLAWFAKCGIISLDQLMRMLAHPEKIDAQIAFCMKRLSKVTGKNPQPQQKSVAEEAPVQTQPAADATLQTPAGYAPEYMLEDTITFTGRGWGHGVGMSQWQAKAMAENGWSCEQILHYYFPGTTLEQY